MTTMCFAQHLTLQNPSIPQIPLFPFCQTQLWLQSRPPLTLQAAQQLSTAVIHPCPAAGSLWNCSCQAGLDRLPVLLSRRATSPSVSPRPVLLPGYTWGMWTPVLSPGQPLPLGWICGKRLPTQRAECFPSWLAKVLTAFSVICQSGYSSLLLGTQPTQQSSDLTYIFNTTFHLTLLSDLSVLQYWDWLLRSAASWTAYPTDTQSFAQQIPAAFRGWEGWKGTGSPGIWWKCSYPE